MVLFLPRATARFATRQADALDRLTPFGERGGYLVIALVLLVSFFTAGYFVVYWRHADMDFMVTYSALVMNDGLPQYFFDHPGYLTILSVESWFRLLHALGLLDAARLSAIPPATDAGAFDAAMTSAVRAARIVSLLTALAMCGIFAALIRRVVSDWRVAQLATAAFAFSGGLQFEMRVLRTELIAGPAVIFALLVLVTAARKASAARPLLCGLVALSCMIALDNKVQAIFLIAALPVLLLPFGANGSVAFWRNARSALPAIAVLLAAAAFLAWLASPLIAAGFDPANMAAMGLQPLLPQTRGLYQITLVSWLLAAAIAYALVWRVSLFELIAAVLAAIAGAALGLCLLYIQYNASNAVAVMNPIELLLSFGEREAGGLDHSLGGLTALAFSQIGPLLAHYTFVLHPSPRPTIFLIWLIVPGIIYAWRRGERPTALQAMALMLAASAIDVIDLRRGLKNEYFILSDPLIIIAGALLLDALTDLRTARWAYPIGVALVIAHLAVGQAEPAKFAMQRSGPESICEFSGQIMPKLPLPWCLGPPRRS